MVVAVKLRSAARDLHLELGFSSDLFFEEVFEDFGGGKLEPAPAIVIGLGSEEIIF